MAPLGVYTTNPEGALLRDTGPNRTLTFDPPIVEFDSAVDWDVDVQHPEMAEELLELPSGVTVHLMPL